MAGIEHEYDGLLAISEVARFMGVSDQLVCLWLNTGQLTPIKIAGRRLMRRDEVHKLLAERLANPPRRGRKPKN